MEYNGVLISLRYLKLTDLELGKYSSWGLFSVLWNMLPRVKVGVKSEVSPDYVCGHQTHNSLTKPDNQGNATFVSQVATF